MNIKEFSQPHNLEYWSFVWSEVRLIIAAIALLIGGVPVLRAILPIAALSGLVNAILIIAWIISGVAAAYLLYRWIKANKTVFSGKQNLDLAAFFVSVVSGLNLGITGVFGNNIGMSIFSSYIFWVIGAIIYLAAAVHLFRRWKACGKKVF
jgi:hypothetical protein